MRAGREGNIWRRGTSEQNVTFRLFGFFASRTRRLPSVLCTADVSCSLYSTCKSGHPLSPSSSPFLQIMSSPPPSPSLKDLPKVAPDLKSELEDFKPEKMKRASTQEKNVLPSAEDVAQERTQQALIKGVEDFDTNKLKHTTTLEKNPLPDKEVVQQERVHQTLLEGVEQFDKATMKQVETNEKNPLPDPEAIEQEKGQQQLIAGIEGFDPKKLKHTETQEKNPLPTKEAIEQEKTA